MESKIIVIFGLLGVAACSSQATGPAVAASAGCQKLGDTSRAVSELFTSGNVYSAKQARERPPVGRIGQYGPVVGADLYVHATPDTNEEYLERTLVCHSAYGQAVHPDDPFHPSNGSVQAVHVRSSGSNYAVRIVGSDRSTSAEILQRAQALSARGTATIEQVSAADGHHAGSL